MWLFMNGVDFLSGVTILFKVKRSSFKIIEMTLVWNDTTLTWKETTGYQLSLSYWVSTTCSQIFFIHAVINTWKYGCRMTVVL